MNTPNHNTPGRLGKVAVLCLVLAAALLAQSTTTIHLVWDPNPPEEEVTAYHVYQAEEVSGPWARIQTVTDTNAIVEIAAPGRRFWYVTAENAWGESDPSYTVHMPRLAGRVERLTIKR